LKEAVICIDAPATQYELEKELLRLMEDLREGLGIEAIAGVGETVSDFAEAPKSYAQAKEASSCRFLAEYGEIIPYGKIKGFSLIKQDESFININTIIKKIEYNIQKGDIDKSTLLLDIFLSALRENPAAGRMLLAGFFSEVLCSLNIPISAETTKNTNGAVWDKRSFAIAVDGLDSLSQTKQYLACFLKDIASYIKAKGSFSEFEIVKKVIEIIEARYSEDLDMKLLSEEIHLSPYYIGTIFKRFTGKLFSQYLNDYRIDTAKEILQSKKVKMNHLGEVVGIRNTSYFCALFKSRFGISPGEYREILKGRWEHV
jgi:two-component system response regulator YesN